MFDGVAGVFIFKKLINEITSKNHAATCAKSNNIRYAEFWILIYPI